MAVSRILRRSATYEDLLPVPPPLVAEIVDGDLYTSPRPAPRHTAASSSTGFTSPKTSPSPLSVDGAASASPHARLEVCRREGEFRVLLVTHAGDALVRAEPFADVELDLLLLWGETRP